MQNIAYTSHTPENEALIVQRIRAERPRIFMTEAPETLNPIFSSFMLDRTLGREALNRMIENAQLGLKYKDTFYDIVNSHQSETWWLLAGVVA